MSLLKVITSSRKQCSLIFSIAPSTASSALSTTTVETVTTFEETLVFSGDSDGSTMVDEEWDEELISTSGCHHFKGNRDATG